MKQADFLAAKLPRGARVGRSRSARHGKDWELVLASQIRYVLEPLGFPLPLGRGFGTDRQMPFAMAMNRKFTADYAWSNLRLLVEVQGGIWRKGGGAHSRPANIERDCEKAQLCAVLGYTLIPVTPKDIRSGHAIELIRLVLERLGCKPGLSATARIRHDPAAGRGFILSENICGPCSKGEPNAKPHP